MKFFISILLTALLSFALGLQFPWWMIAVAAFIVAVAIPQKPGRAFFTGFIALFLLWGLLALWIETQTPGGAILARQVATILKLGGNAILLVIVTGIVGGLVAGMGALTGSLGRRMVLRRERAAV